MVSVLIAVLGFALGLISCLVLAVADWAAWVLVLPSRRPGTLAAQVDFALNIDSLERSMGDPIEARGVDGVKLAGLWHESSHPRGRCRGTVLLIHGFAEDPSGLRARMEALNAHGWNVAALDARAHGRSEGDRGTFGARESKDVASWIAKLSESGRISVDSPTLAIWGRSMGAAIAIRAVTENPSTFTALILEAPYVDLRSTFIRVLARKRVPFPRLFARLILRRAGKLAGASLAHPRPIDMAPSVQTPTMILHGTEDSLIPLAEIRGFAKLFAQRAEVVEVLGGGHHTVVEVGGPPLLDRVARFLDHAVSRSDAVEPVEEAQTQVPTGRTFNV